MVIAERRVDVGGFDLNYAECGAGAALVVLHGGSARWQQFDGLVRELGERWRVVAPDLRGHGKSGRGNGQYHLSDYADDIVRLLDRRVGRAALFGHSLGGQVALLVAARRAELVRALVLGDAPFDVAKLRPQISRNRPMLEAWLDLAASDLTVEEIVGALRETRVTNYEGRPEGRAADVLGGKSPWFRFMAESLHALDPATLDAVIEFDAMHDALGKHLLAAVSCPVLLLQADPAVGGALSDDEVQAAMSVLRHAQHVRFDGCGHVSYLWRVGPVIREFLAAVDELA